MRDEFTGMLPGAIVRFEALFSVLDKAGLNPEITGGYSGHGGEDDLRSWGVVCYMKCNDRKRLETEAAILGITIREDGSMAYTNGLIIDDFKTMRVGADLTLQSETKEV
jgi:hypothetical protein